jgi:hypothetical protein
MSKAGFTTPENQKFYEQRPYGKLNCERREIRLLRVQRQRMTVFEVEKKWPEWRDKLRPIPCNEYPQEPPGDGPPYTTPHDLTNLLSGWKAFTSSTPKLVSLRKRIDKHQSRIEFEANKIFLELPLLSPQTLVFQHLHWRVSVGVADRIRVSFP